jgi:hypothetical protein
MKKLITAASVLFLATYAHALTFTNQTVTVSADSLTVESVAFVEATTNAAARWEIDIRMDLPRGHVYALNGHPCTLDRFRVNIPITASEEEVAAVFGEAYAALQFAAANGLFVPAGDVAAGFLLIGSSKLAEPAED